MKRNIDHPLWQNGGVGQDMHGGIDHLVFAAFVNAVKTGAHAPIDVYDAATYMCITALSEESVAKGGAPVAFPDLRAADGQNARILPITNIILIN